MKKTIYLLFLLFTLSYTSQFFIKNNKIYDKNGGTRIFHGVNLVKKVPPYYD